MGSCIKEILTKITPSRIIQFYQFPLKKRFNELLKFGTISYSQEGEDLILKRIFENTQNGFFVDVGAHHPKRFSNTFLFYQEGWRGINIDPMPNIMESFKKERPEDINLEIGISDINKELTYYIFNETALNTFSKLEAEKSDGLYDYKVIDKKEIYVFRLDEILDKYVDVNQKINFLSIDVEGLDLNVLKSNNWIKYRPQIVLAEVLNSSLSKFQETELAVYLYENDYELFAKTVNTLFFKDKTIQNLQV